MFRYLGLNGFGFGKARRSGSGSLLRQRAGAANTHRRFLTDAAGNTSMIFMMTLVPTLAFVGAMTDFGRGYIVKQQLGSALDAASLVGGRTFDSTGSMTSANNAAQQFFYHVLPHGIKASLGSVKTDSKGNVSMVAASNVPTIFLPIVGINNLSVQSQVQSLALDHQSGQHIEIALVMDVTGSMADNNKLVNAKSAATALVNTLLPTSGAGNSTVRISIVPFSEYVNVGGFAPAATNTPVSSTVNTACKQTKTVANFTKAQCTQPTAYVPDQNNTPRDHGGYDQHGYKPVNTCGNNWGCGSGDDEGDGEGDDHGNNQHQKYQQQDADAQGYDHHGRDQFGYDKNGWDIHGCDQNGVFHGAGGEDTNPSHQYAGNDQLTWHWATDSNGNWNKYDQHGFDQNGYDMNGRDVAGYDQTGYDQTGYDHHQCDHNGLDHNGRDLQGFDQTGYDQNGYDRNGCDHNGKDRNGNQVYNNPFAQGHATGYAPITSSPPPQVQSAYSCSNYANNSSNPYPYTTTTISTTCPVTNYLKSCVAERLISTGHAYDDAPPSSAYFHPFLTTNASQQLTCSAPAVAMTPLSNDRTLLLNAINSMVAAGGTSGHLGTAWGWYTLSPNWSGFWSQAVGASAAPAPNGGGVIKIAIIMTDGGYNLHYDTNYNQVNDDSTNNSANLGNGLSRTQALNVCGNMKSAGIEVFTIGVEVQGNLNDGLASDAAALTTLQNCASNADQNFPTHFYNIVNNNDPTYGLVATFQNLATQIASATGTGNQRLRMTQ